MRRVVLAMLCFSATVGSLLLITWLVEQRAENEARVAELEAKNEILTRNNEALESTLMVADAFISALAEECANQGALAEFSL